MFMPADEGEQSTVTAAPADVSSVVALARLKNQLDMNVPIMTAATMMTTMAIIGEIPFMMTNWRMLD